MVYLKSGKFQPIQNKNAVNAHRCVFCTPFLVYTYISAWALLFILIGRFTRAKIQGMSKDKGSTLCFYVWVVGAASRKNYGIMCKSNTLKKRIFLVCAALLTAAASFATVTYDLGGGVTNDYGWQSKKDMYEALNADWNAFTGATTTWLAYGDQLGVGKSNGGIPTSISSSAAPKLLEFFAADTYKAKWGWLPAYMDIVAATQYKKMDATKGSKTVPSTGGIQMRFGLGNFFGEDKNHTTDYIDAVDMSNGEGTLVAFQPTWKHSFCNPTEPKDSVKLIAPYKEGLTFDGWYASADFTGDKITHVDSTTTGTLYAKFILYVPTIAEVKALEDSTETRVAGVVNYVGGKSTYIQDVTGGIVIRSTNTLSVKVGDKVTFYGKKVIYDGFVAVASDSIITSEVSTLPTATSFEGLSALVADAKDSVFKYNAMLVRVPGVKITAYDKFHNPTVTDGTNTALCYYMALDETAFPVGTKVTVTAVATSHNGVFQFTDDAAGIEKVVVGKKDAYAYPARGENGEYTLENNWVISNIEDNFEANKPGPTDNVRGMAAKDGKMYFINRANASITVVDGATGNMLDPIAIKGEHLFEVADSTGKWSAAVTLAYNDIKFDGAGNCLIGCCTGTNSWFFVYKVDLTTGEATELVKEHLYSNPNFKDNGFRFDAFGVYGDVNNSAIIMATDANSFNAYKWDITNGKAANAEEIICTIDPKTDQSLLIADGALSVASFGTAPQTFPVSEDLFYVDGWSTLPMLFDMSGSLKDDFVNSPKGVAVVNNEGDTCKMNTGHNGLVEFQVGDEYFLLMAATNTVGTPTSAFALYKFADEAKEFTGLEPMWYFPAAGMGAATNGCRTAVPSVEVKGNVATLYIYTVNNGYAAYTFTIESYYINLYVNDENMGNVNGDGLKHRGTATIAANPRYGYHFTHWNDGNTDNPRTITLTQDTTFTAYFAPNKYTISVKTDEEYGVVSGDTVAEYLSDVILTATAHYGYHFSSWDDGNADNPRIVRVVGDASYRAIFEKNTYRIAVWSANEQYGNAFAQPQAEYMDSVVLHATSNLGYHFTQWNDGNTDNPRTIELTRDTTFTADFAQTFAGQCGENLYWKYAEHTLTIYGAGDMYDYETAPWLLFRDTTMNVVLERGISHIGDNAFSHFAELNKIEIPHTVASIGEGAFAECRKLFDVYSYATEPPLAENNSFANYNVYLHVPCDKLQAYQTDMVFGSFKYIQCIGAENTDAGDDVTVTPSDNNAVFVWPADGSAASYTLEIRKDGVVFCTLVFNANGQLSSIAFAPARNGQTGHRAAEQTAGGFRFTVTGLTQATHYEFDMVVKDENNETLHNYTGEFTTNTPTSVSTSETDTVNDTSARKVFRNGQVYILRGGKTYTLTGEEVK